MSDTTELTIIIPRQTHAHNLFTVDVSETIIDFQPQRSARTCVLWTRLLVS